MDNEIGFISSLIGDPVRLKIMWALMDGRAFTATELAISADTSPQNVSMHLAKLVQGEFLTVESQGENIGITGLLGTRWRSPSKHWRVWCRREKE